MIAGLAERILAMIVFAEIKKYIPISIIPILDTKNNISTIESISLNITTSFYVYLTPKAAAAKPSSPKGYAAFTC